MINSGQEASYMINSGQKTGCMINSGQKASSMINSGQLLLGCSFLYNEDCDFFKAKLGKPAIMTYFLCLAYGL